MLIIPFLAAALLPLVADAGPITSELANPITTTTTTTFVPPRPTQSGLSKNCKQYYKVNPGDTCFDIEEQYIPGHGSTPANVFNRLNPDVGKNCDHLQAYNYVCVGTTGTGTITSEAPKHSPTSYGLNPKCTKFFMPTHSESCLDVEQRFGITRAQFVKWNPKIENAGKCFLLYNYYYCVAV